MGPHGIHICSLLVIFSACAHVIASPLVRSIALDTVPDGTSQVLCVDSTHPDRRGLGRPCFLVLRRRGEQLYERPGPPQLLVLDVSTTGQAGEVQPICKWHSPVDGGDSKHLTHIGASYSFYLMGLPDVSSKELELMVEVRLGRLHFIKRGPVHTSCAGEALWIGAKLCGDADQAQYDLHTGLTVAVLDGKGAVAGIASAKRIWIDVYMADTRPDQNDLWSQLSTDTATDVFHLAFHSSIQNWAAAHAAHPQMHEMGSFIGPSESHPRGLALPMRIARGKPVAVGTPTISLLIVLTRFLSGRNVELLEIHVPTGGWQQVLEVLLSAGSAIAQVASVCILGISVVNFYRLKRAAAAHGLVLIRQKSPLQSTRLGYLCFNHVVENTYQTNQFATQSPLVQLDKATASGLQLQASLPVASFGENGHLQIPSNSRLWIEVGCNNWEMLRDQVPHDSDVYLVTFEPLIDKFAYIYNMAQRRGRHVVLPLAIAPAAMDSFVPIRSQNYSNFRGTPGRRFQESGASSLLRYAPGFEDHKWSGAQSQYKFFREYLVPTVSLAWVVDTLLGGHEIDFLKIDAQGLDYAVFSSLGPFTHKVHRVQMELHTHIRHDGEHACTDVLERMTKIHNFTLVQGRCKDFDPSWHDEVDLIFEHV